jgi:hypothetical protein
VLSWQPPLVLWCWFLHGSLGASPFIAAALLLLSSPFLVGWLSARPQLVDYAAVLLLVLLLRRLIAGRDPLRCVLAVGILSFAWVNLHAGALLGVAIVAAVGVLTFLNRVTRARAWWLVAATGVALTGSLLNTRGFELLAQTARVRGASAGIVIEWQHLDPANLGQMAMWALGLAALVLAVRRRDVVLVGALATVAVASVGAIRFLPMTVLLALPVLAASTSVPPVLRYVRTRGHVLYPGAAAVVTALAVMAVPSLTHVGRPDPSIYPREVVDRIPPRCRVFNSYLLGGFVMLERPDVSVSIDSRTELYGAERVIESDQVVNHGPIPLRLSRGLGACWFPRNLVWRTSSPSTRLGR